MKGYEFKSKKKSIATMGMAIIGLSFIIGGTYAMLNDTFMHNETVVIEWVDIMDDESTTLALEDVNDQNNTSVTNLIPGVTYELTGTIENVSSVETIWSATNLSTTPGMTVDVGDVDGDNIPIAPGEALDVSQFEITVILEEDISPEAAVDLKLEFSAADARGYVPPPQTLSAPTAIIDIFDDPQLAACVANDAESGAAGNVNHVVSQADLDNFDDLYCSEYGITTLDGIEYFRNLTNLNLNGNQISDIAPIVHLTNLTTLILSNNQITSISALYNLTNLTTLTLSYNQISNLAPLEDLVNLTYLDLNNNLITDISALSAMDKLTKLYLSNNYITDFSPLTYYPATFMATQNPVVLPDTTLEAPTQINIDGVNGDDLIIVFNTPGAYVDGQIVWENPGVNSLSYFSDNGKIQGTITQSVNEITTPTAINKIFVDPALAACVANDGKIGANGDVTYPITQEELNNITNLNCVNQGVTSIEGVQYLHGLVKIDLNTNQISDITPLTYLTNLTMINLNGNLITDITPLANLTNLTDLYLGGNQITSIEPIANLTNLSILNLKMNKITDITPLAGLNNLVNLNLSKNQISDFSSLTYQPTVFTATGQNITLPETTLATSTTIALDGIAGNDFTITFNTPGTYTNGQLTWENPGVNSLTYTSSDGTITGTITQTVY